MASITITGIKEAKLGLSKIRRSLRNNNAFLRSVGRELRDDARRRITTQDGGSYPKLSKWTRAKTGRRKALITERNNIQFRLVAGVLQIGHEGSGGWELTSHEKGFTLPGLAEMFTVKRPNFLAPGRNLKGDQVTVFGKRPSKVPARRVFPTQAEANVILVREAEKWIGNILKRNRAS